MHFTGLLLNLSIALAGYPIFFASFEDVGKGFVDGRNQKFEDVDDQLTEWLTECKSDIFIIIKDSNPFDFADLHKLRRFAEQSLTVGSFMTDYPINLYELADDISVHCHAPMRRLDIYAKEPTSPEINQRRTYYIEFDSTDQVPKSEYLSKVMQHLWSPYVTIVYGSSFGVVSPIFPNVERDPKREQWTERYSEREHVLQQKAAPVVKPMLSDEQRLPHTQKKAAREAKKLAEGVKDYLPDDTFATIFVASIGAMALLLLKNAFF